MIETTLEQLYKYINSLGLKYNDEMIYILQGTMFDDVVVPDGYSDKVLISLGYLGSDSSDVLGQNNKFESHAFELRCRTSVELFDTDNQKILNSVLNKVLKFNDKYVESISTIGGMNTIKSDQKNRNINVYVLNVDTVDYLTQF